MTRRSRDSVSGPSEVLNKSRNCVDAATAESILSIVSRRLCFARCSKSSCALKLAGADVKAADKSDSSRATFQLTNIDSATGVVIRTSRRGNRYLGLHSLAIALTRSRANAIGSLRAASVTKRCRGESLADVIRLNRDFFIPPEHLTIRARKAQ